MNEKYTLVAFLATLAAIVSLSVTGALMATNGRPAEALGLGVAISGLIGVIGTFKPRNATPDNQDVTVTNSADEPVPADIVTSDKGKTK